MDKIILYIVLILVTAIVIVVCLRIPFGWNLFVRRWKWSQIFIDTNMDMDTNDELVTEGVEPISNGSRSGSSRGIVVLDEKDVKVDDIEWSTTENADTHSNRILLLGDSILDNGPYVPKGFSVYSWLRKMLIENEKDYTPLLFARDGYTITDVYLQLSKLPIEYNTTDTSIVLSIGGNDFLSGASYVDASVEYTHLIDRIRKTFDSCKLYLVNLYSPPDPLFVVYDRIIDKWNKLLKDFVDTGKADGVIDIYRVMNQKEDVVHKIEPSVIGGEKIALAIMNKVVGE